MPPAPSGRQTVLVEGDHRAVIVEVGGGVRHYSVGGDDILDGYGEGERCSSGRGQPLVPWPNRLEGGAYHFGDVQEQAPLTEPGVGNAIHGLTRWSAWSLLDAGVAHATTGFVLRPQPGWAWTLELRCHWRLADGGLHARLEAVNRSATACPFGAGFHPYLRAPSGRVDDLILSVPAATRDLTDARGIPTGSVPVAGTDLDFRTPAPIGATVLDTAYTDLERDATGHAVIGVTDPGTGREVEVRLGPEWTYAMVFTGDTVGARARQGLAVEPMTGPANLLRSGRGLVVLEPGGTWSGAWSVTAS